MKIEIVIKNGDTTKNKGDLLEKMSKEFLVIQNFEVEEELRNTGMELDLLCKNKTNPSKIVYVECKAYEDKKIQADVIKNIFAIKGIKKYQEAWLICTSELGKDAKGLINDIKNSEDAKDYFFYTPDKLVQAFIDSSIVCDPSTAKQKIIDIIDDQNKIDEGGLLITEYGRFWVFKYFLGGIPAGALITYSSNGDIVKEKELLENLKNLNSSFKNLNFFQIMEFKDKILIKIEPTLKDLLLLPEVISKTDEIGMKINHPKKDSLCISDIFVFPDLEDVKNENEIINSKKLLDPNNDFKKSIILGAEISGKTTLAYMIQKEANARGSVSIYLKAEQIKKSDFDKFTNLILTQFEKNYSNDYGCLKLFEESLKSDRSNILIIIDDFDLLKIKNESAKFKFLEMLRDKFDNVLIFANRSMELEVLSGDGNNDSFRNFRILKIKQFGYLLRDELIEKWLTVGGYDNITDGDLLNKKVEISGKIKLAVGTNFIPTYPLYMLTMLQLIEDGSSLKLQGSSYAELYRYLINQSLGSVNAKPEDLDFLHTYLSFFAYYIFINDNHELSRVKLIDVYKEYCQKMDIGKSFKSVHDLLIRAKLIKYENDLYKFNHSYSYYYFVAKYLSDNISEPEIIKKVDEIIDQIYKNEFANIIIFFIHHTKYNDVIDKILKKSSKLFSEITPYSLSKEEMDRVNNLIHEEINLCIDDQKTSDRRKNNLARIDQIERETNLEKNQEADESQSVDYDLFNQINLSAKLIEILGQIVTSYYGSINGNKKSIIIDEICSLGLRSLRALLEDFTGCIENTKEQIESIIDKKRIIDVKQKEKILNNIIYSVQEILIFIFIKKISEALASKNLFVSTDKIIERNNNPAGKIISTGVRLNFPNEINLEKILNIDKEFDGNYLAKRLLRLLTIEHLYKFEVDYAIKQKICDKLDIKVRKKLIS